MNRIEAMELKLKLLKILWFTNNNFLNRPDGKHELCHVYYAPLNFRDIMLASGKLPPDALPGDLAGQVSAKVWQLSINMLLICY